MAKLTKQEARAHAAAVEILHKDVLTDDDKWAVLANFHAGANHINSAAGAFFTPPDLASDFAIDAHGARIVDLCAGVGTLAFACASRFRFTNPEAARNFVCVEINPDYVAIGRKIMPEATWICGDVFDVARELGRFDCAIANPPFGATPRGGRGPRYSGRAFEYHLMDLASDLADYGAFIIPQGSAPFVYSGVQCYRDTKPAEYLQFQAQTGITLEAGCGVDCSYHLDGWKGVKPNVEIVCADFEAARATRHTPAPKPAAPVSAQILPDRPARRPVKDPAEALRAVWTAAGVPEERQAQLLFDFANRAAPRAAVEA